MMTYFKVFIIVILCIASFMSFMRNEIFVGFLYASCALALIFNMYYDNRNKKSKDDNFDL
ncbi:hypothetical protein AN396_01530 [Candidatus Epulonipiscium fishelsonii]|uniref:Uncharacterized protein n=1 Tax=Candidatus Epulonipiscium fishelsonii TaxID=77094 RepID=A0ACC8X9X5_9FIRM|nr:hypothetical protein AN396_01530 [Epulopiscium sp. SCG-B11WGA-EpuloA1]